jgi:hypothetical protein
MSPFPLVKSLRIYPIYIGYLNSIRHHIKKGTLRDHQLVRRKNCREGMRRRTQNQLQLVLIIDHDTLSWLLVYYKSLLSVLVSVPLPPLFQTPSYGPDSVRYTFLLLLINKLIKI